MPLIQLLYGQSIGQHGYHGYHERINLLQGFSKFHPSQLHLYSIGKNVEANNLKLIFVSFDHFVTQFEKCVMQLPICYDRFDNCGLIMRHFLHQKFTFVIVFDFFSLDK